MEFEKLLPFQNCDTRSHNNVFHAGMSSDYCLTGGPVNIKLLVGIKDWIIYFGPVVKQAL